MADLQHWLDLLLLVLLALTLFHALRLERALRALRADRQALDGLLGGFSHSTRQAEAGIDRLRGLTEVATTEMMQQAERGRGLKDDLVFLIDRAEASADRLEAQLRAARPRPADPPPAALPEPASPGERPAEAARMRSQAERDLLAALKATR
jgi:hypothetical protein